MNTGSVVYRHNEGSGEIRLVTVNDPKTGHPMETVQGTIPSEWVEGARICGFSDVRAYAVEQIKIQRDMNGGNLNGLRNHESAVYK